VPEGIVDREPHITGERILEDFQPPPLFRTATFDSYVPSADEPSQGAAVSALEVFSSRVSNPSSPKRGFFKRAAPPEGRPGVYLDGGFGVGKTHLLAALFGSVPGPKSYGTFVEYTNLVGALGFRETVTALSSRRLVCIDEFELDDPGDTVLMSTLLGELVAQGVFLAATSNTLPDRLGEERFAAEDFLREIQGLSAHFDVFRIEGPDYRHRDTQEVPPPRSSDEVIAVAERTAGSSLDRWSELQRHLTTVHPSRYGHMVEGISVVCLEDVRQLQDQAAALRIVVLIDRLYDREIPVVASGVALDEIFSPTMLKGGYRKKYFRAISRIVSLARDGEEIMNHGI